MNLSVTIQGTAKELLAVMASIENQGTMNAGLEARDAAAAVVEKAAKEEKRGRGRPPLVKKPEPELEVTPAVEPEEEETSDVEFIEEAAPTTRDEAMTALKKVMTENGKVASEDQKIGSRKGRVAAQKILKSLGADTFSQLPQDKYRALVESCEGASF